MQIAKPHIQARLCKMLKRMADADRFPHTLMLEGADGFGTLPAASCLAAYMLCGDDEDCLEKIRHGTHPDLTYVFPTAPTKKIKTAVHTEFYALWREFMNDRPFGDYSDWMSRIDAENKQGLIRVADAEMIAQQAALYPALAPRKVFILWHAEKMNAATANKMLKILEEPPPHTYFFLLTDDSRQILPTVLSRTQSFNVPPLAPDVLQDLLTARNINDQQARMMASIARGDIRKALQMLEQGSPYERFAGYFVQWMRVAYSAKGRATAINELVQWADTLAAESRTFQIEFLRFVMEMIRRAYTLRFTDALPVPEFPRNDFRLQKFAPFVHPGNVDRFYDLLNDASYQIIRNANSKLTFLDLSVQLTRLLHS